MGRRTERILGTRLAASRIMRRKAEARVGELEGAIEKARYALDPNQGEHPDPTAAHMWLRTTLPPDHPNHVTDPNDAQQGNSA